VRQKTVFHPIFNFLEIAAVLNLLKIHLTGLLLGAAISKNIASFLEENELFVPTDDDDDD